MLSLLMKHPTLLGNEKSLINCNSMSKLMANSHYWVIYINNNLYKFSIVLYCFIWQIAQAIP
jgi:hypothetical protein